MRNSTGMILNNYNSMYGAGYIEKVLRWMGRGSRGARAHLRGGDRQVFLWPPLLQPPPRGRNNDCCEWLRGLDGPGKWTGDCWAPEQ